MWIYVNYREAVSTGSLQKSEDNSRPDMKRRISLEKICMNVILLVV